MDDRKKRFPLNIKKVEQEVFKSLSVRLRKGEMWLYNLQRKARKSDGVVSIWEEDAERLAISIGCSIEDIGSEENEVFSPIRFDFPAKQSNAQDLFDSLLPRYTEELTKIFQFMEKADSAQMANLNLLVAGKIPAQFTDTLDEKEWWKLLYFECFIKEMLKKINFCTEDQLKARLYQRVGDMPNVKKGKQGVERKKAIQDMLHRNEGKLIQEFMESEEWDVEINKSCALFLDKYFAGQAFDPSIVDKVSAYKIGRVCELC